MQTSRDTATVVDFEEFKRTHAVSKETLIESNTIHITFPFFIPFIGWMALSYMWEM